MTQPRILIVDNNKDYLDAAQKFFEAQGYFVLNASSPDEARPIFQQEPLDLAILDIRLIDNDDEKDTSGLELAKQSNPAVPKVMLTDYPSFQTVREAFSPVHNGGPLAVGYIAKAEGLEALLESVRLALLPLPPVFEKHLLRAFGATAPVALRNRLREIEPGDMTRRLRQTYEDTASELRGRREQENHRGSQLHTAGLVVRYLGILLILVACCVLIFTGSITGGVVTLIVGALTNAVELLFSRREDKSHQRAEYLYTELEENTHLVEIVVLAEMIESSADRDDYIKKIIDKLLSQSYGAKPPSPNSRRTKS